MICGRLRWLILFWCGAPRDRLEAEAGNNVEISLGAIEEDAGEALNDVYTDPPLEPVTGKKVEVEEVMVVSVQKPVSATARAPTPAPLAPPPQRVRRSSTGGMRISFQV